jgi:hypothetical protein
LAINNHGFEVPLNRAFRGNDNRVYFAAGAKGLGNKATLGSFLFEKGSVFCSFWRIFVTKLQK